jgi:hypothetical protein
MSYPKTRAKPGEPIELRLRRRIAVDDNGCWIWTGAISSEGYGTIHLDGKCLYAHRVAYEAYIGAIPAGLETDHICRNRACCNPDHLEPVPAQVNNRRGMSPGARARRRDRCRFGHLYIEHGYMAQGRRLCGACWLTYQRLRRQLDPAEIRRRKREGLLVVDLAAHFAPADPSP